MLAAFDAVDHDILLERLAISFGMAGTALAWLRSFLTGRSQQVYFTGGLSSIGLITTGLPQGSVFGPLLFLLYSAVVPLIANQHGLGIHCYADGQIYVFDKAAAAVGMINKVASCIEEIDRWMSSNHLKLNSEETQFIWLDLRWPLKVKGQGQTLKILMANISNTVRNRKCQKTLNRKSSSRPADSKKFPSVRN